MLPTAVILQSGDDIVRQVSRAYRLAFGREPDGEEIDLSTRLVRDQGLPTFCRVLLNANEFVFLP